MKIFLRIFPLILLISSCLQDKRSQEDIGDVVIDSTKIHKSSKSTALNTTAIQKIEAHYNEVTSLQEISTGSTTPEELLNYAQTLIGIPYKYGSTDPRVGFDCSGFITHVFNHFKIAVPRSSISFTHVKTEIPLQEAEPGDLILFTGTDSTQREVGHMGIITSKDNSGYQFIHSTSGKRHSVTITPLNQYYMGRFMKVIRVFKRNDK
jgi:cell wall-associated NlpC family hydrolase